MESEMLPIYQVFRTVQLGMKSGRFLGLGADHFRRHNVIVQQKALNAMFVMCGVEQPS